ncbi:MAG: CDP-alcohol phosphatidyltransferase family protein [Halioglobus sp.]
MLKYLPNALTTLRLLLALPLGVLILRQDYQLALWVGLLAGITDALDGFAARRLNYFSPLGAALDPVADKLLVLVTFVCLANIALIDWKLAAIVIGRDLVIVGGAVCYRVLIGSFEFGARPLSKLNMIVQIFFCILILATPLFPSIPGELVSVTTTAVIIIAITSGLDYIVSWSKKALMKSKES